MSAATGQNLASLLEANTDGLLTCVHCGLCLPACPTYRELGNENDSPRGRIYLMRGFVEKKLDGPEAFSTHIDLCLGCRACETACPSGVPYGHLLEAARAEVSRAQPAQGSLPAAAARFALKRIFTHRQILRIVMVVARLVRDSRIARLAFESAPNGRFKLALALLEASRPNRKVSKTATPAPPPGNAEGISAALLHGCVMEGLFGHTNQATERVLIRNGCRIATASGEVCCGALHAHAGEIDTARKLARTNIDAFLATGCERIIANAAGCGAAMKEYGRLLAEDPVYRDRAREFSDKVRDISEFLVERGLALPAGRVSRRVAYDAPCHLLYAQRVSSAPLELLEGVPGVELIPLIGSENCCGGAGIYNLLHPELSLEILSEKLDCIRASGAQTVATGNPGCIMQLGAGLLMRGIDVDVAHPIDLLDAAYQAEDL